MDEARNRPYPIVLTQLDRVKCVVVGGGEVAVRKIRALLDSGARVIVISPDAQPQIAEWREAGQLVHVARPYTSGDLSGAFLAIAATDRREVNAAVAEEARQHGMLCNIADDPAESTFHTLGAVMRGDVLLAVGTGGDSPALAAHIRRKLEATFGPEYGVLAHRLGALRREIGSTLPAAARARLWRALVSDEVLEWVRSDDLDRLERYIAALIAELSEQ
ncbi:MAG TPA: bifunctional precorrin-2 dehydrogenase/sirohydrochlorin ferrochelatase [Herpetosiphonaceae bacterium]